MNTPKVGRTRKAVQSRNEIVLGQPIRCYDNGGSDNPPRGTIDRYTVVFLSQPEPIWNGREYFTPAKPTLFNGLGMNGSPFHPQGFCQHINAVLSKHLGRIIKFSELPEDCQKAVKQDLRESQTLYVASLFWRGNDAILTVAGYDKTRVTNNINDLFDEELNRVVEQEMDAPENEDMDESSLKYDLADDLCSSGVNAFSGEQIDSLGIPKENLAELESDGITVY